MDFTCVNDWFLHVYHNDWFTPVVFCSCCGCLFLHVYTPVFDWFYMRTQLVLTGFYTYITKTGLHTCCLLFFPVAVVVVFCCP